MSEARSKQGRGIYTRYTDDSRAHFNGITISRARFEDEGDGFGRIE